MSDGRFEKVQQTDAPMYGPPKLILCGFPAAAQPKLLMVLEMVGLRDVAVVWAGETDAQSTLADLLQLPDQTGAGSDSALARAIVVSGITHNQLHNLMTVCRKSGMQQALWAALTPTSETWPLASLLSELQAERKALSTGR